MSYKDALKHVGKELKKKEPIKEFIIIEDDIIEEPVIESLIEIV